MKTKNTKKTAVKKAAKKTVAEKPAESKPFYGPDVYKRNKHGLLDNTE